MTFTEDEAQVAIMRLNGEIIDCSICHKPMLYKYSHNAYPVNNNRCCERCNYCLLYTSPSPRDRSVSRMPSSA